MTTEAGERRTNYEQLNARLLRLADVAKTEVQFAHLDKLTESIGEIDPATGMMWRLEVSRIAIQRVPGSTVAQAGRMAINDIIEEFAGEDAATLPTNFRLTEVLRREIFHTAQEIIPEDGWLRGASADELAHMQDMFDRQHAKLTRALWHAGGSGEQLKEDIPALGHWQRIAHEVVEHEMAARSVLLNHWGPEVDTTRLVDPIEGVIESRVIRAPGYMAFQKKDDLLGVLQRYLRIAVSDVAEGERAAGEIAAHMEAAFVAGQNEMRLLRPFSGIHSIEVIRLGRRHWQLHLASQYGATGAHAIEEIGRREERRVEYFSRAVGAQFVFQPDEESLASIAALRPDAFEACPAAGEQRGIYHTAVTVDPAKLVHWYNALTATDYGAERVIEPEDFVQDDGFGLVYPAQTGKPGALLMLRGLYAGYRHIVPNGIELPRVLIHERQKLEVPAPVVIDYTTGTKTIGLPALELRERFAGPRTNTDMQAIADVHRALPQRNAASQRTGWRYSGTTLQLPGGTH